MATQPMGAPAGNEPTPQPAGSTPAEASGSTPVADVASPEQATPAGSTPTAAQPPAQPDPTANLESLVKRYGTVERAVAEFYALEKRAADMAKRLKAPPEPAPTVASPAAPLAAGSEPVAPEPEHPAPPPPPTDDELAQYIDQAISQDPECHAYATRYSTITDQLRHIGVVDQAGRLVGGRLHEIGSEIRSLRVLTDTEQAKKFGFTATIDEYELEQARVKLQRLEVEHLRLEMQAQKLEAERESLSQRFDSRVEAHRQQRLTEYASAWRQAEQDEAVRTSAQEFEREWTSGFDVVCKNQQVPDDIKADIRERAVEAALVYVERNGKIAKGEVQTFLDKVVQKEMDKVLRFHRVQSKRYADQKSADIAATQQAPNGQAAVAPVPSTDNPNWEKRLNERRKAYLRGELTS